MQTLLARLAAGAVTSAKLTEALLARAEQTNDLGAFISLDTDRVLRAARVADQDPPRGPLHGLPLAVKDNIHVAGLPNTAGSKALAGFVPERDATVVARLRAAGAIVLGKTNMHEFAFGATNTGGSYGPARNPADPARYAGGSSGGTATCIASGAAPAGLGTDTGGSVRIPAALTGIAGLRPTTGRYPGAGVTPLSWTRDTVGPMAPAVADLVVLDGVLAADPTPVGPLNPADIVLAVPEHHFTDLLHPRTAAVWEHSLEVLARAGITLEPVQLPDIETVEDLIGFPVTLYEAARRLPPYLREGTGREPAACLPLVEDPDVRAVLAEFVLDGAPKAVSHLEYERALRLRDRVLVDGYARIFRTADAVLFPTTPLPAGLIATESRQVRLHGSLRPAFQTYIRNTGPGSIAGLPGVTVPAPCADPGLPVGLALDGARHTDRALLGLALLVEQLLTAEA